MSEALQNKGEHKLEYLVLWKQAIIHIILFQSFNIMIVYRKNTYIMNLLRDMLAGVNCICFYK